MSVEHHDLHHEFPELGERIHELKVGNAHFRRLFDEYHEVDHEIHRIETGVETTSDDYLEERKNSTLNYENHKKIFLKASD